MQHISVRVPLAFRGGAFDSASLLDVLEHAENEDALLAEVNGCSCRGRHLPPLGRPAGRLHGDCSAGRLPGRRPRRRQPPVAPVPGVPAADRATAAPAAGPGDSSPTAAASPPPTCPWWAGGCRAPGWSATVLPRMLARACADRSASARSPPPSWCASGSRSRYLWQGCACKPVSRCATDQSWRIASNWPFRVAQNTECAAWTAEGVVLDYR
jgi:hypothetical protein